MGDVKEKETRDEVDLTDKEKTRKAIKAKILNGLPDELQSDYDSAETHRERVEILLFSIYTILKPK